MFSIEQLRALFYHQCDIRSIKQDLGSNLKLGECFLECMLFFPCANCTDFEQEPSAGIMFLIIHVFGILFTCFPSARWLFRRYDDHNLLFYCMMVMLPKRVFAGCPIHKWILYCRYSANRSLYFWLYT